MLDINIFISEVLAKGNQELSEDKQIIVRLTDVLDVLQKFNDEEKKTLAEIHERRSEIAKKAGVGRKKTDSKGTEGSNSTEKGDSAETK